MEQFIRVILKCSVLCSFIIAAVAGDVPPCGLPLYLTPLIRSGNLTGARAESRSNPLKGNITSFSGFLTVNDRYNSNLFFWYFVAETNPTKAPVILWLQGGPGTSALSGVFNDNGPFYVKLHRGLKQRKYYWSQIAHMIYIDSPIGTGFSFTDNRAGYARNVNQIADNLYESLLQYFAVFQELRFNDFYIVGESYGAKFATMLAYKIDLMNPRSLLKINLKGIALQNAVYDPANMMIYSDYLYQIGLVDAKGKTQLQQQETRISNLMSQRKYIDAFRFFDAMIGGEMSQWKTSFQNLTYYNLYYNFLHFKEDTPYGSYKEYIKKDVVRHSLHVGNLTFHLDQNVKLLLVNDLMASVKSTIESLLEKYRIMFYVGQMDIIVNYPLIVNAIKKLRWSGALQYDKEPRKVWKVDDSIAGYSKSVKKFTEILVLNAGHRVSYDQPKRALDMIKRFVTGQPFTAEQD